MSIVDNSTLTKIESIFNKYNVPKEIWYPIMLTESGGNPDNIASTSSEYSVGLFQINLKAHPQYSFSDVIDPIKNAEIAAKDFISPVYQSYKNKYTGLDLITNVYKDSERPQWTYDTMNRIQNNYKNYMSSNFYHSDIVKNNKSIDDYFKAGSVDQKATEFPEIASKVIGQNLNDLNNLTLPQKIIKYSAIFGLIGVSIVLLIFMVKE